MMSESFDLSDDEAIVLLRQRMEQAGRRVALAAFARGDTAASVDNNGTASLIQFPSRKLIVTNFHVWDEFRREREDDSNYRIALTGGGFVQPVDISDAQVVDESEQHDLCILEYPSERLEAVGKEYCVPPTWPPVRAADGEHVAIAGYPGIRRSAEDVAHPETGQTVNALRHEICLLYMAVEAVSDSQIRMTFRSDTPETLMVSERPMTEYRWGGMSGSLVYRFDELQASFVPCGIFRAAGEGSDTVFYATHLDRISAEGEIAS